MQGVSRSQHILDLVSSREWASIKENHPCRLARQKITSRFKHDLQTEVILAGRIFDLVWRKDCVPDFVLAQNASRRAPGEFARKRGFSAARQPSHENNHDMES